MHVKYQEACLGLKISANPKQSPNKNTPFMRLRRKVSFCVVLR